MDYVARSDLAFENRMATEPVTFETAVQHACRMVPVVQPAHTAAEIKELLWTGNYQSVSHIVVCDKWTFVGILRIEDLLKASGVQRASELMDRLAPRVGPQTDREIAAWTATQHGESALAVVDEEGQFMGLIPPHQLLRILLTEHEEDLARLGGYLRETSTARLAGEESYRATISSSTALALAGTRWRHGCR